MTGSEAMQMIGRRAQWHVTNQVAVAVKVIDCRQVWSRVDCLIVPVAGDGEQWVSLDKLKDVAELAA